MTRRLELVPTEKLTDRFEADVAQMQYC